MPVLSPVIKHFYLLLVCIIPYRAIAQNASLNSPGKRLGVIFEQGKAKPQVLLLGVFHFAGEQVDANTTPANLRVDMLSAERQKQIAALVKKLAAYRPTKIAVELYPQSGKFYDSLYREYCAGKPLTGKRVLPADEVFQLAFRLAREMNLLKVYPINAPAFRFALSPADSLLTFEKYKDQTDSSFTYWDKPYDAEKAHQDSLGFFLPLNKYLQYLNSPEKQARSVGRWLISTKRGSNTEPIGADGFITRYFNRNVRIYSNVQRIITSKNDRVLVIYGATHIYLLKQLFAANPEFDLKDVMPYLK